MPNPEASTSEAQAVLERAFLRPEGLGSPRAAAHVHPPDGDVAHPERALRHGDRLTDAGAGCGHLVHMATHIDVLCGDYQNVVRPQPGRGARSTRGSRI
jgi:hypothetical protein